MKKLLFLFSLISFTATAQCYETPVSNPERYKTGYLYSSCSDTVNPIGLITFGSQGNSRAMYFDFSAFTIVNDSVLSVSGGGGGSGWSLTGNAGTNPATNFIGTTDSTDLVIKSNNIEHFRAYGSVEAVSISSNGGSASPNTYFSLENNAVHGIYNIDGVNTYRFDLNANGFIVTGKNNNDIVLNVTNNLGDPIINAFGNGNVGIGTTSPASKLDVVGRLKIRTSVSQGYTYIDSKYSGGEAIRIGMADTVLSDDNYIDIATGSISLSSGSGSISQTISLQNGYVSVVGSNNYNMKIGGDPYNTYSQGLEVFSPVNDTTPVFTCQVNSLSGGPDVFKVLSNGNVGIGTPTPTAKLQVVGSFKDSVRVEGTDFLLANGSPNILGDYQVMAALDSATGDYNAISYNNSVRALNLHSANIGLPQGMLLTQSVTGGTWQALGVSGDAVNTLQLNETNLLFKDAADNPIFTALTSGNVGIGTATPSEKLEVAGNIKTSGDVIVSDNTKGVIIYSPDGTPYRITVDNLGVLTAVVVP